MKASFGRGSISPARVATLLALSFLLMLLPSRWQESPKLCVSTAVVPLQWFAMSGTRCGVSYAALALDWIFGGTPQGRAMSMAELQQKVEELEQRLAYQEELLHDAQAKLANLTGDKALMPSLVAVANVIAQDSSDWRKSIIVDRGARNGVQSGMIAYWNGALVGRVTAVGPLCSRVTTVIEPASRISVRSARSRAVGILQGTGSGLCRMKYVGSEDDVKVDDEIVTAGIDGFFPPHLIVGRCIKSESSGGQMQSDVVVQPSISPKNLESIVIGAWTAPDVTIPSADEAKPPAGESR
jgi:rod shape-determining protein MreC